jgi:PAS domain S-box-containing protein
MIVKPAAQFELEDLHAMLEELFQLSPTPSAVFDAEGDCVLANRAFALLVGVGQESLSDCSITFEEMFVDRDVPTRLRKEIEAKDVVRRREVEIKSADGSVSMVLLSARRLLSTLPGGLDISLLPISERKRLQRTIRRDRARMQSLLDGVNAGLFLVSREGKIAQSNRELSNLVGIEQRSIEGERYQKLFAELLSQAVEPEVAQQSFRQAVLSVSERPVIDLALSGDRLRHLRIELFPVWADDGAPRGWGGLILDVTEARERLAWKLELLSVLAHDIRVPLATLKGHATALLANFTQWGDDMVKEFLRAIDRSTDKLVRQVDRSLALTRVEAGSLGLRPSAVDASTLIEEALERAAGSLGEHQVRLSLPEDVPQVRVDPDRVEEVLLNLLENAARFSPAEEPIRIRCEKDDHMLTVSVIDRGPGVPPDRKEDIFRKFEKGKEDESGSGLGLFITRKIVEAHGGKIWVQSPPEGADRGAQFSFTLPLMPEVEVGESRIEKEPKTPASEERAPKGTRVLVVEDEPDFQALLRTILSDAGYAVEVVPDGPAAVDVVQTSSPDLVLLDWMLPGMDGPAVCRNIRRWSSVPILLVTSKTAQQDLITALDAGADDYVTKPFKTPELLARARSLLRRGESWKEEQPDRFNEHGLLINFDSHQVWMEGEPVELTPTEFKLLAYLARHKGQVLTYEQLLEHLYGLDRERKRHDLFVHISRLRRKIEPDPEEDVFIVTRWGVGYVFMPS